MNKLILPQTGPTTSLSATISDAATTLPVMDTTDFTSTGVLALTLYAEPEIVTYSGKTSTSFTGVTRGTNGSTARSYAFNSPVIQAEWMPVIAEADTLATTSELAAKNATIQYQNEGVDVATKGAIQYIDFVGASVDVTSPSVNHLEVAISGGGSGLTHPEVMARTLGC